MRSGLLAIRCSATPGYRRICRTLLYFSFALQENFVSERCGFCIAGLLLIIVSLTQTTWFLALFIFIISFCYSIYLSAGLRFMFYFLWAMLCFLFFVNPLCLLMCHCGLSNWLLFPFFLHCILGIHCNWFRYAAAFAG